MRRCHTDAGDKSRARRGNGKALRGAGARRNEARRRRWHGSAKGVRGRAASMIAEIHVLGVLVVVALLAVAFFVGCMYADRRRDRELGVVTIERWGQATPRPKVSVSAQG